MKLRTLMLLLLLISMMILAAGCIPGDGLHYAEKPAGFFWGIWHGWIAPVSLVIGVFNRDIRIYETANIGWWYDLGYYIAIISGFGGLSLFRQRKGKHKEK